MVNPTRVLPLILSLSFFLIASASKVTYNVQNFGAKPDGKTDSTEAFLGAWAAACASTKSAMINVPVGRYLVGGASFWGQKCKNKSITMRIYGTLVAPSNYNTLANTGNWLKFERVNGLTIAGGTLDGQGASLWACKTSGKNCPGGASVSHSTFSRIFIFSFYIINFLSFYLFLSFSAHKHFVFFTYDILQVFVFYLQLSLYLYKNNVLIFNVLFQIMLVK